MGIAPMFDDYEPLRIRGGTLIDVRTEEEFELEHAKDAILIPMNEVSDRLDEIRNFKKPLILCCRSGSRSQSVKEFLIASGLQDVYNIGPWQMATSEKNK